MIHTARQSGKFISLVRRLRNLLPDSPVAHETIAIGILESLWHAACVSAKRGNIGCLPNEVIAEMCGWLGDADELIELLVECRWLDRSDEHRLLIHDWQDHAPNFVRGVVKRQGGFLGNEFGSATQGPPPRVADQGSRPKVADPGAGPPNLTQPNPTSPPTPPPTESPLGDSESSDGGGKLWEDFQTRLAAAGVTNHGATVAVCRKNYTLDEAQEIVREFVAKPGAWGAGALCGRLTGKLDAWPEPSVEWQRIEAGKKRKYHRAKKPEADAVDLEERRKVFAEAVNSTEPPTESTE